MPLTLDGVQRAMDVYVQETGQSASGMGPDATPGKALRAWPGFPIGYAPDGQVRGTAAIGTYFSSCDGSAAFMLCGAGNSCGYGLMDLDEDGLLAQGYFRTGLKKVYPVCDPGLF